MNKILRFMSGLLLFSGLTLEAQVLNSEIQSGPKTDFVQQQTYLSKSAVKNYTSYYGDSLKGFNEGAIKVQLLNKGIHGAEYIGHTNHLKREFINHKYTLVKQEPLLSAVGKLIGGSNVVNVLPCVNEGFESNAPGAYPAANSVVGWTVSSRVADLQCSPTNWTAGSSEFSIVATPILSVPNIGTIPHSPLGGTVVAQLNNFSPNYNTTKLSQTFPVTSANCFYQFAYAGFWQDGGTSHGCCEQAAFKLLIKDCFGVPLSCRSLTLNPYTGGCPTGLTSYTTTSSGDSWTNWQVRSVDLTPFIGSCITVEIINADCGYGGHFGVTFFDSRCGNQFTSLPSNSSGPSSLGNAVNFCAGANVASIQGPLGYTTYSWVAPSGGSIAPSQASLSAITVTNPIPGSTYTLNLATQAGCLFATTYTLYFSSVGISALGTSPTCSLGTSGSGTVLASGSGSGYNYTWLNSANFVISTSSVVTNLSPGIYSINVSAIGAPGCGSTSGTVNITSAPPGITYVTKPVCGNEAFFSATSGTTFRWYSGLTTTTPTLVSTASSYTASPISANYYWLSYITGQGCKDSIRYSLAVAVPGSLTAAAAKAGCNSGLGGGVGLITLIPSTAAPFGSNYFIVNSTSITPFYNSFLNPTSLNSYTAVNLSANGIYSVNAFDGACKYSTTFSVGVLPSFSFSLSSPASQTLCASNPLLIGVVLSQASLSPQYTYSWSPTTFLFANNGALQQTVITPTTPLGTQNTIIYTVAVTPTSAACPQTTTLSITLVNQVQATLSVIPQLCANSAAFAITANPSGGIFTNNLAVSANGIINSALATIGVNTFTYATAVGPCAIVKSSSFNVGSPPTLTLSGNFSFCEGQPTTLLAGGANTYLWSNASTLPFITVSPLTNTTYSVTGFSAITSCSNSAAITVTVMPLPVLTITGNATLCAGESATLTANGSTSYLWNNGSTGQTIIVSPGITSSYTVQGANNLGTCFGTKIFTVKVIDCTDTTSTVGIEQWLSENSLRVYPNPNTGKLFIESKYDIGISIQDGLGRVIAEEKIIKGIYTLNISNYPGGVYLLKATYKGETKIIKLVKND